MKPRWLDRNFGLPGPCLALCTKKEDFEAICREVGVAAPEFTANEQSHAARHIISCEPEPIVVVCIRGWQGRDPIEVAGLLIHEAVHIWQDYAESIGESSPGSEQEAYAVQSISQTLMAEFVRQTA